MKSLARNVVLESSSAEVSILTCVLMYVFSLWAQEIRQAAQSDTFSSMWLAQPETQQVNYCFHLFKLLRPVHGKILTDVGSLSWRGAYVRIAFGTLSSLCARLMALVAAPCSSSYRATFSSLCACRIALIARCSCQFLAQDFVSPLARRSCGEVKSCQWSLNAVLEDALHQRCLYESSCGML